MLLFSLESSLLLPAFLTGRRPDSTWSPPETATALHMDKPTGGRDLSPMAFPYYVEPRPPDQCGERGAGCLPVPAPPGI